MSTKCWVEGHSLRKGTVEDVNSPFPEVTFAGGHKEVHSPHLVYYDIKTAIKSCTDSVNYWQGQLDSLKLEQKESNANIKRDESKTS